MTQKGDEQNGDDDAWSEELEEKDDTKRWCREWWGRRCWLVGSTLLPSQPDLGKYIDEQNGDDGDGDDGDNGDYEDDDVENGEDEEDGW